MIRTGIFSENFLDKERNIMINIVILIFSKLHFSYKQAIILSGRKENMLNSFITFCMNILHVFSRSLCIQNAEKILKDKTDKYKHI